MHVNGKCIIYHIYMVFFNSGSDGDNALIFCAIDIQHLIARKQVSNLDQSLSQLSEIV